MNENIDAIKIPVTIITGFLGSGKTTLLNNIIKKHQDKKFAIFENEFGEIGIDGGLIVGANENIFEMANGCICCSLNDRFFETIIELLKRPQDFNHLLIETTGIADPDSIIKAFITSDDMQKRFRIDSVICIADAINMEELLDETPEVRKQLALADTILINKVDAVNKDYCDQLTTFISEINPMAKIYPVSYANISDLNLLDVKAYTGKEIEKATLSFRNLHLHKTDYSSQSPLLLKNKNAAFKHEITSEGFAIPGNFDFGKFNFWMQNYLFYNSRNLFRVKGILSFNEMDERYICHAVKNDLMLEAGEPWGVDARFNKLIFIGKKIDRNKLEDALFQLLIK